MRPGVALVLLLSATAGAHAEGPVPIAVQPFSGRCFDAAQLAERVRARVGDLPVTVAAPPHGSRQEVRVWERGELINVEVTARDARGQLVGSAHRLIPADDCATALEVAGLIVARAAMPLNWRESPAEAPRPSNNNNNAAPATANPPANSAVGATTSSAANNPPTSPTTSTTTTAASSAANPAPAASASSPASSAPAPPTAFAAGSTELRAGRGAREPGTIVLSTRGPNRRWVGELDAAVYGAFNLDAGADNPGGELGAGFRRGRFGAAVRGAVERDWSTSASSPAGPISLSLRRADVALEAHADIPLKLGALRFVVGPSLVLWTVGAGGLPHPRTTILPSFAVAARLLYRLDLGRVFLAAGVDFEAAPVSEDLTVTGVGVIAHTPRLSLGPILALGVNL